MGVRRPYGAVHHARPAAQRAGRRGSAHRYPTGLGRAPVDVHRPRGTAGRGSDRVGREVRARPLGTRPPARHGDRRRGRGAARPYAPASTCQGDPSGPLRRTSRWSAMTGHPRRLRPTDVGWRLGRANEPRGGELWVPWDRTAGVIGPQGSGKTLGLLVPALLDAPGAAMATLTRVDDLLLSFDPPT